MVNKMNILAVKEIKVDFPYSSTVDERSPVCLSKTLFLCLLDQPASAFQTVTGPVSKM